MTSKLIIICLTLLLSFGGTACRSKAKKASENIPPATEMEANFKQRWIDRRAAELKATGQAADAALRQAQAEFNERFSYIRPSSAK